MKYTKNKAVKLLQKLNIDINDLDFDLNDIVYGMNVESEHGKNEERPYLNVTNNNYIKTGKIALAHLFENPNYYKILKKIGL